MTLAQFRAAFLLFVSAMALPCGATVEFIEHLPSNQVFGEAGGTTMREPEVPREDEPVAIWLKIGYSFYYTDVAIYYTTDGSTPSGSKGVPGGSSQVLKSSLSQVNFVRNESSGSGNMDWWVATLPSAARAYGVTAKYIIGAWHSSGGPEVFANNYGCSDGTCDNPAAPASVFSYTNKLAWPGRGAFYANHAEGYPVIRHWKEEGVVGNKYLNAMLDQNGTLYDLYYPSAGAVQGVATKNEGYVDGLDTFPPGLPLGHRGQMNVNQAMAGLRVDGKTYWLSNENGYAYSGVAQSYLADTNVIQSASTLSAGGNNILVRQFDFAPAGISFPLDLGAQPNRGLYVKRYLIKNNGPSAKTLNFYYFGDFALNGGDSYDQMAVDTGRGSMIAYDRTTRMTGASGEYNPSSFPNYSKSVSLYLGVALKHCSAVGSSLGTPATDNWRDTSADNDQGWIGTKLTLAPGEEREIDVLVAGGFDAFAEATGTYDHQIAPALDWFASTSMASVQSQTEGYWKSWLDAGVTVDLPGSTYDDLFNRSLLATALHLDGKGGGVVAGMHNGAYPYVWPRDAVYAAVTLARAGHVFESSEVYRFLRDVAFRSPETWGGKGFWYQKYTTDGYIIWSAPQVDETSVVPWGVRYHYLVTGDAAFLTQNYAIVNDAARASSQDSTIDSRLYYDDPNKLMYSMNVWEDSFDDFIYSNASVYRGLTDAADIAEVLGHNADAALFTSRAANILDGLRGRLAWNGENTDISQLGLVYPFSVLSPTDPDAAKTIDRINGVAADRYGQIHGLVNGAGEWEGLINRYWGDSYWNGGPWFLSTLWYGLAYAERADHTPGSADIDVLKSKLDKSIAKLGPIGLGAEQMAPANSLLYPGQSDFSLQAAWPNAWESMSTLVDSVMAFLDYAPDAPANTLRISPKLPRGWQAMTFRGVRLGGHRLDITLQHSRGSSRLQIKNLTGLALSFDVWLKSPLGSKPRQATVNGVRTPITVDNVANRARILGTVQPGANSLTTIDLRNAEFDK